jgi:hypothetical protein
LLRYGLSDLGWDGLSGWYYFNSAKSITQGWGELANPNAAPPLQPTNPSTFAAQMKSFSDKPSTLCVQKVMVAVL